MKLPELIKALIGTETYELDTVGLSRSSILLFRDKVLKIEQENEESHREMQMMEWLKGTLPVPEVICHEIQEGMSYLLMSRLQGVMACDSTAMKHPEQLVGALAAGLQMLWQVDISDCVYWSNLDQKLEAAKYNVEHGLVEMDRCEPDTFGEGGFENPEKLLGWLMENRPEEEYVLSHGDYCLPNVFVKNGTVCGFLDLGKMGIADKYQDIALCYRSLLHNYQGKYGGGMVYEDFRPESLFAALGMEADWEKVRYYILLDELF